MGLMPIDRRYPLSPRELTGWFRFQDLFQLLPAPEGTPRPGTLLGPWGLVLEVDADDATAEDRAVDLWAHDLRERQRLDEMLSSIRARGREPDAQWQEAERRSRRERRLTGIRQEALRLINVATRQRFYEPQSDHSWVLSRDGDWTFSWEQVNGSPVRPSAPGDLLTIPEGQPCSSLGPDEYFSESVFLGDTVVLPANLHDSCAAYFGLSDSDKLAFGRAAELYGVAREIWPSSRSVSMFTFVVAIETLIHADDPTPPTCKKCQAMTSETKCGGCGGPLFGLTRRFREFVRQRSR